MAELKQNSLFSLLQSQSNSTILIPSYIVIKNFYGVVYIMGPVMCGVLGLLKASLADSLHPVHEGRLGS